MQTPKHVPHTTGFGAPNFQKQAYTHFKKYVQTPKNVPHTTGFGAPNLEFRLDDGNPTFRRPTIYV